MKKNFMKKFLLSVCMAIFMLASIAGVVLSSTTLTKAKAAESWQTSLFEMEDGVSLQFSKKGGMRYIVKMDESVASFVKENESVEMGFVIAPQNLMLAANGDYLNMPKKIGGPIDKDKIYEDGDYFKVNGCITGILYNNLLRDFTAVAYIKSGDEVRYTEYNTLARNNLYDLVNMATLNGYAEEIFMAEDGYSPYVTVGEGDEDGWYGTEEFPIVIESTTDYNGLVSAVNMGVDFSAYQAVVENGATATQSVENPEYMPTILSGQVDELNRMIEGLPNSITMPDAIGVVASIHEAERAYKALPDGDKSQVVNYGKVETLLTAVKGYDRVYKNGETDGTVIPSYVPGGYASDIGGGATTRQDSVYGNVLTVQSDANGRAALSFENFPDVSGYEKVYFYVRILGVSCDIYLSDGTTNDGWGANWKNTWSTSGYWCNADKFRLIEIDVAKDGFIGTEFALGFRTKETGITFEITDFYGYIDTAYTTTELTFGAKTDSGETNEYGKIYNISREQWYIDNNNVNTIGTLQTNKLANALPAGYENFYFWMYNGTGTEYNFHLAGDVSGTWTDSADSIALKVGEWTKITISAEDIALNKKGQWYVYLLGGDGAGAAKDGWKISTIYAGPQPEYVYSDYADVKGVVDLINALPQTITLSDKEAVEAANAAYEGLSEEQQALVNNAGKLASAKNVIANIEKANVVVALIDSIDARDVDEALVKEARAKYNDLPGNARAYVTNIATLEAYEAELLENEKIVKAAQKVNEMLASFPDTVTMPDHLVFVSRIEAARDAYNALSEESKALVEDYAKLRNLLSDIKGYETVYRQSVSGVNVIPSYVPGGYSSTIGGSASMGYDSYYGDYLKVTAASGGRPAIQFINFPNVSKYAKIYFNIRVVGASCDIYLSDGITNDGWGEGWNNTWSITGLWANNGNWIQKEVATSTNIFASNWALGLRTNSTNVSFEITDIIGWAPDLGTDRGLTFGNFTASGETNVYGTVYNFTQGWSSDADMGAFNQNALKDALAEGHDSLHFWMYNPQENAVEFKFTGEMNGWDGTGAYATTLAPKAWTEVVITPEIIDEGTKGTWFVGVTSGAGASGWKVSPIYSYSSIGLSDDNIEKTQNLINALNVNAIDEDKVTAARTAYEALNVVEKSQVDVTNLVACEKALYGEVNNAPFITNSATQYKIYYEAGNKAPATFMQEQLTEATGATLPLVSRAPEALTKYCYAVVFGYRDIQEGLGVEWVAEDTVGSSGYRIQKLGRVVFIQAYGSDGYRMGALAFLREVIGYNMISEDCIIYSKDGATLPAFSLTEKPSFDYRQQQTYMTKDELYGMGLQAHTDIWIPSSEGWDMHNSLHYLPTATYRSAHPAWYYDYTDTNNVKRTQVCPTAGGSSAEFNAMVKAIADNMMVQINAYPTLENISFSIMDTANGDDCQCARCKLYDTLYGEGGFAAAWIELMNAVNANIQARIGDRKLNIAFLAYRGTEKAPANSDYTLKQRYVINDNGSYALQTDANGKPVYLQCDDEVAVWLAPINGKFAENFNHADNAETLATIKKWTALSNNVYLWMYGTNFKNYLYPYNSWQASAENYKILADLGVKAAWSQSNETEATAFSDLKGYIDAQFMFNANADYEAVLDTYFNTYYGAAAEKMRTMFDMIVARCDEIEAEYNVGRGIYDELENKSGFWGIGAKEYWSKGWCDELVVLCDEAKALVNGNQAIISRITKESLFPRYLLCTTFANQYSSTEKKEMRRAFKADAEALGIVYYKEADGEISNLYKSWGI